MEKRSQPQWNSPTPSVDNLPPLQLYNSLTLQKEPFVPLVGRKVSWYACGPTVYDASHMGHARCYLSTDIMRRVLMHYFGYEVTFVMNITDIDDKIIKRARQKYLLEKYAENEAKNADQLKADLAIALNLLENKLAKETDNDKKDMLKREVDKVKSLDGVNASLEEIFISAKDCLSDWLDKEKGSSVNDNAIFVSLPEYWEERFHEDMRALNVLSADVLTRVREFIPQIVEYIEKIIVNGFAYESHGSVYFNTNHFANDDKHFYAKLVPTAFGDASALAEGEGDLFLASTESANTSVSGSIAVSEKRSPTDFALWKASKAGEPAWDSPWGKGRPGWHIECSVMASETIGDRLDIHSGGIDLKFPHHDNELAQSEAYFNHSHWVNYFLHAGHLTIQGCKMSKSLKNFVTIAEALTKYSSRRIRLAFLMHSWKDTLDFGQETMVEASAYDKLLADFFFVANHYSHWAKTSNVDQNQNDVELLEKFKSIQQRINDALCDSIDTREALFALKELILQVHSYATKVPNPQEASAEPLNKVAQYITWIMRVFGCDSTLPTSSRIEDVVYPFGLDLVSISPEKNQQILTDVKKLAEISREFELRVQKSLSESENASNEHIDCALVQMSHFFNKLHLVSESGDVAGAVREKLWQYDLMQPWLNELAAYREKIRSVALSSDLKGTQLSKSLLIACDWLRNEALPDMSVRLEDRESGPPAIGLVDLSMILEEKAQKQKVEENRLKEKQLRAEQEAKKAAQAAIPPEVFFTTQLDLYSQFDNQGIPTHDASGKEISKGQRKKLQKTFDNQKKLYEQHCLKNKSP